MKKILIAAMMLFTLPALAGLEKGACKKIVKETCGKHKGDRKAFKACMKENKDKFPEECRERAKKMKEKRKERREQNKESAESSED